MRTIAAVALEAPPLRDVSFRQVTERCADWLDAAHPVDGRPAGVRVRVREGDDDPVWQAIVDEAPAGAGIIRTSSVTVIRGDAAVSCDVRVSITPTVNRVAPVPVGRGFPPELQALVVDLATLLGAVDAGRPVRSVAEHVTTELGAHGVAAFLDAPRRRLPVLIEAVDENDAGFGLDAVAASLTGMAHCVIVVGRGPLAAFHEFRGGPRLVSPGTLTLVWPGRTKPVQRSAAAGGTERTRVRDQLVDLLRQVAASSTPPVRPPRRPLRLTESAPPTSGPGAAVAEPPATATSPAARGREESELLAELDATQQRVAELEAALSAADAMIAEKQALLERRTGELDQLILQNVQLSISLGQQPASLTATSAVDALAKARETCPNLVFHKRAFESATALDAIDATSLLVDLHRLDRVAGQWRSGDLDLAVFPLACRSVGLDYASDVSETAKRRYAADYAIDWKGRTVFATAHLRHGRGSRLYRVHLYLDQRTREVVVAYVGRHLRDKTST
jgi:hypothetical protein